MIWAGRGPCQGHRAGWSYNVADRQRTHASPGGEPQLERVRCAASRFTRAAGAGAARLGELTHIAHADWNLEIGTLIEIVYNKLQNNPPAILFEDIAGYSTGSRLLSGMTNSAKRLALTLGFPVPENSRM